MVDRDELLKQARRRYPDFLRAVVEGTDFFPLDLRIGKTRRAQTYGERVTELKRFHTAAETLGLVVEWQEVNDPRFGPHKRPERAFFADEAAYLRALGKGQEVVAFLEDAASIRAECPLLASWIPTQVQAVVAHHGVWPTLLRVV